MYICIIAVLILGCWLSATQAASVSISGFIQNSNTLISGVATASLNVLTVTSAKIGGSIVNNGVPLAAGFCILSSATFSDTSQTYVIYAYDSFGGGDTYTKMVTVTFSLIGSAVYVKANAAGYVNGDTSGSCSSANSAWSSAAGNTLITSAGGFGYGVTELVISCSVSVQPSAMPTTAFPSVFPTVKPTQPTGHPTDQPSGYPTDHPTGHPSGHPTDHPTDQPSGHPTDHPTGHPSGHPSGHPTDQPSGHPTDHPTGHPSGRPTDRPTAQPTLLSTSSPSGQPTTQPGSWPTYKPFSLPSSHPSYLPSRQPTNQPSSHPSSNPTSRPSVVPSRQPSSRPTHQPYSRPSCLPAAKPTSHPSDLPSCNPSNRPSSQPNSLPTVGPTLQPSTQPTGQPSSQPTNYPSRQPTSRPSSHPSRRPSDMPSSQPSYQPTSQPTIQPSIIPSTRPSLSPMAQPTSQPSRYPSDQPTLRPTRQPSSTPSRDPTSNPSDRPSRQPSSHPSNQPSIQPSSYPSNQPSMQPTCAPLMQLPVLRNGTLPTNKSVSVLGLVDRNWKIVIPQLLLQQGDAEVFSDIKMTNEPVGFSLYAYENASMYPVVNVALDSIRLDTTKRSACVLPDVNGDGFDDLIIGDPFAFKCYVLYGSLIGLHNMTSGFTISGEIDGDLTGWSVSGAGDVNNDTIQDIIIGAPNVGGIGAVYLIYGKNYQMNDVKLSSLTSSQGFVLYGASRSDYFGISVSFAGDVNKDGCDDIVIGAIAVANYFAGAGYIVFGTSKVRSSLSMAQLTSNEGCKFAGVSYQYAGISVSGAGDMNKDGYGDVVIGTSPSKTEIALFAYIIYGSKSLSSMSLSALGNQGIVIRGGGNVVAYSGDIYHNGCFGVQIAAFSPNKFVGVLIFGSLSTLTPSSSPSKISKPSRVPTVVPSLKPSRQPYLMTVKPSSQPVSGEVSLFPIISSDMPSETPTAAILPSVEPTEVPTVLPSTEPTEKPKCQPSKFPTCTPSNIINVATFSPSIASTAYTISATHSPVAIPTLFPSIGTESPVLDSFVMSSGIYNDSGSHRSTTRYVVNATGNVMIDPSSGECIYYIMLGFDLTLIIGRFNISTDMIDLSEFRSIIGYSDLVISAGSVVITLPTKQIIRILDQQPSSISERNFIFSKSDDKKSLVDNIVASEKYFVTAGVLLLAIYGLYRFYCCYFPNVVPKTSNQFIITYEQDAESGDIIPFKDCGKIIEDSVDLSEHTIDSNGVWQMKANGDENFLDHAFDNCNVWQSNDAEIEMNWYDENLGNGAWFDSGTYHDHNLDYNQAWYFDDLHDEYWDDDAIDYYRLGQFEWAHENEIPYCESQSFDENNEGLLMNNDEHCNNLD